MKPPAKNRKASKQTAKAKAAKTKTAVAKKSAKKKKAPAKKAAAAKQPAKKKVAKKKGVAETAGAVSGVLGCCTLVGNGPALQIEHITREACRLEGIARGKNDRWVPGECAEPS